MCDDPSKENPVLKRLDLKASAIFLETCLAMALRDKFQADCSGITCLFSNLSSKIFRLASIAQTILVLHGAMFLPTFCNVGKRTSIVSCRSYVTCSAHFYFCNNYRDFRSYCKLQAEIATCILKTLQVAAQDCNVKHVTCNLQWLLSPTLRDKVARKTASSDTSSNEG